MKMGEFTNENVAEMVESYAAASSDAERRLVVESYADSIGRSIASIRMKLVSEGVYQSPAKTSKNGKGWAAFFVEDYNDSYEFRIFGEDYLKLRHFLVANSFVFFKVFVKEGWANKDTGKKGEPRLQFNSMMQLQDVMETYAKKITLHLKLEDLKQEQVMALKDIVTLHKGEKPLYVTVHGIEDNLKINMPSRKQKVAISSEFLQELQQADVVYKLN